VEAAVTKVMLGTTVFDAAVARLREQYEEGHRIVVSCSGGKDSLVCMETAIIAARQAGRLPVEAVTREEEIIPPGTREYLARVRDRPEVELHWLVAHQPSINAFDREQPYWWIMDPQVDPDLWVVQPPPYAEHIADYNIEAMTIPERFPPPPGRELRAVVGLRVQESRGRRFGLYSSGGYLTKPNPWGVRNIRPVYDWLDGDVWRAIHENGWDYNDAYDVLHRAGVPRSQLRISPPTMSAGSGDVLRVLAAAWPSWWDRVCRRLPSVRTFAQYGKRAVTPQRGAGETWEACFKRTCIERAPAWIAERAELQMGRTLSAHGVHSSTPLPDVGMCKVCGSGLGSWRELARALYLGDPFSVKCRSLPYVQPERFRSGEPRWGGIPG
jgi:predicted phosphoadenosine phosphosulfate sulfurtransferase